jgi:hypothetical protein
MAPSIVRSPAHLPDQSGSLESLTEKFSQAKRFTIIEKVSIEEIASAIGAPEEVEIVLKLLKYAAPNVDHPIKKIPPTPPFRSRYQYGQE